MASMTRPQASVAIPWVRGSVIRGTLRAREMVAKARMASKMISQNLCYTIYRKRQCRRLTHGSNNLGLETELVLETTGEVGDSALAVACDVRDLADVVEHVATGEEKDGDQADCGPEVAALDDGEDIRGSDSASSDRSKDGYSSGNDLDVVDGTNDRRSRTCDMAGEPGMDGFGSDDTGVS